MGSAQNPRFFVRDCLGSCVKGSQADVDYHTSPVTRKSTFRVFTETEISSSGLEIHNIETRGIIPQKQQNKMQNTDETAHVYRLIHAITVSIWFK